MRTRQLVLKLQLLTMKFILIQLVMATLFVFVLSGCSWSRFFLSREPAIHAQRLTEHGYEYYENHEYAEALRTYNEALKIARDSDPTLSADIYYRIGRVHINQHRYSQSLVSFKEALALVQKFGTRLDKAMVHNSVGNAYQALGQVESAAEHYLEALANFSELCDQQGKVRVFVNLGSTYLAQGRYAQALEYYENAKKLADTTEPRSQRNTGAVLTHMGSLYAELGQYDKALTLHQKALETYKDGHDLPGIATALHNIGYTHAERGNYSAAIASFREAVSHKEELRDQFGRADTLNSLGFTLAENGQTAEALSMLDEALLILKDLNASKQVAATLDSIGVVYKQLGDYSRAMDFFNRSLAICHQLGDRDGERITLANIGDVLALQKKIGPAILFYKMSVNITQEIRIELKYMPQKEQRAYVKRIEENYRRLVNLLIDQGRLPEAEQVLAMLKEEEYFEFLNRQTANGEAGTITAAYTESEQEWPPRYEEIKKNLITIGQKIEKLFKLSDMDLMSPENKRRLEQLQKISTAALEYSSKFIDEIKAEFKKMGIERSNDFVKKDFHHIQLVQNELGDLKTMGQGSVLIYFLITKDRLRMMITTPEMRVHEESAITSQELNHLIEDFRLTLQNPYCDPKPKAKVLYDHIIAPLGDYLQQAGARTLMLSLDDTLRYLPFAALYDGEQYLGERYGLAVYTAAARGTLKEKPQNTWMVAGMGVSEAAEGGFGPLPAVPQELDFIVREEGQNDEEGVLEGVVRLNSYFTKEQLRKDLRKGYPVVHIASHFKFQPGNVKDSFLLLGSNQHLTLEALQFGRFPLAKVELLSLSACETAYGGRDAHGREIESFGVLAQQLGAKAVLATLWPVNDTSTSEFMASFYQLRQGEGVSKAEALRLTQTAFMRGDKKNEAKDHDGSDEARKAEPLDKTECVAAPVVEKSYAHPFFWAPFILMGNFL